MLNSRKGNLPCFQWEVARFQRAHREKMAAVTAQTNNRPTPKQQLRRKDGFRNTDARRLKEVDVERRNAFLVEKMVHIHRTGGFERRSQHEYQDCKAALQFGKTNAGVTRAVHERRQARSVVHGGGVSLRKKQQEHIRRENAILLTRLASPKRTALDFNRFEADFAKSREHHRLAQCDRTVGHTTVFSHCSGSDGTPPGTSVPRLQSACRSGRPRPASAGLSFGHQAKVGVGKRMSGTGQNNRRRGNNNTACVGKAEGSAEMPSRIALYRPHSALGLRRGDKHHDLFDARAADPGWGSNIASMTSRPPSAPERIEWGSWGAGTDPVFSAAARKRRPPPSLRNWSGGQGTMGWGRPSRRSVGPAQKGRRQVHTKVSSNRDDGHDGDKVSAEESTTGGSQFDESRGGSRGGRLSSLGRTLLVEAKVLIGGRRNAGTSNSFEEEGGSCIKVNLRFLSLDGLIRFHEGIRKTLQGFVVEATLATPHRTHNKGGVAAKSDGTVGGSSVEVASTSVAVPMVQEYLKNAEGRPAAGDEAVRSPSALTSFREACPLDERGNYPEINELLGQGEQRDLFQTLLGSCRVITPPAGGADRIIGVELLQVNAGLKLGISVTTANATLLEARTHDRPKPPSPQPSHGRPEATAMYGNGSSPTSGLMAETGRSTAGGVVGSSPTGQHTGGGGSHARSHGDFGEGGGEGRGRKPSIHIRMPTPTRPPSTPRTEPEDISESGDREENQDDGDNDYEDEDEDEYGHESESC
ncbi:unnamed protein product [Ectocarpus sp. 6 AP-2014]